MTLRSFFRAIFVSSVVGLAAVACSGGAPTGSSTAPSAMSAPSASGSPSTATAITERDFRFDTPSLTVAHHSALDVTNAGPTVHNVAIRDAAGQILATTPDLKPGTSATLAVDVPAGAYAIICTLPGHESLGLKGSLTVSP